MDYTTCELPLADQIRALQAELNGLLDREALSPETLVATLETMQAVLAIVTNDLDNQLVLLAAYVAEFGGQRHD